MPKKVSSKPKTEMSIKEAARYLDVGEQYIRVLIRKGTLHPQKTPLSAGARVVRNMIPVAELDMLKNREIRHFGRRDDGRNKFVIYLSPEEFTHLQMMLDENLPAIASFLIRAVPPRTSEEEEDEV